MLNESLSQLEQLIGALVQQNQALQHANSALTGELAKVKEENETLQLSLLEFEEIQGNAAARIKALVERATLDSAQVSA